MLKFIVFFLILIICGGTAFANDNTTIRQYQFSIEKDVSYGTAESFCGDEMETLTLDIFKPLNDDNTLRPLLITIHGGGFISGSKESMDSINADFARRGYVVASIEYRKGIHISEDSPTLNECMFNVNPCLNVFSGFFGACSHPIDRAEVYRTMYRSIQDAKGAIRFMKERHQIDSTDLEKVFIGGASAGGFIAMGAAYLDQKEEKFLEAHSITDVYYPNGHPNTVGPNAGTFDLCYQNSSPCILKNHYERPDLGDVEGTMNQNGYDASVAGVFNLFGGVTNLDWFDGPEGPPLYLFHQTGDALAPCGADTLLKGVFNCADQQADVCYDFYKQMPLVYGTCAIVEYFENNPETAPIYEDYLIYTDEFVGHHWGHVRSHVGSIASFFDRVSIGEEECYETNTNCLSDNFLYFREQNSHWNDPNPLIFLNQTYGESNVGTELKFDFYQANDLQENETRPLIFFIHGEGLSNANSNRHQFSEECDFFVDFGFNTATLDYSSLDNSIQNICSETEQSLQESNYQSLQNLIKALNFIESNNNLYKVDLNQIILVGQNAGAMLALECAYMNNFKWALLEGQHLDFTQLGPLPEHNANIIGVASIEGGLKNAAFAFQEATAVPMLLLSGDCNSVFPYTSDLPFDCASNSSTEFSKIDGSFCIANRADEENIPYHLKTYLGFENGLLASQSIKEDIRYTLLQFVNDYALCCKQEQVRTYYGNQNETACFDDTETVCTELIPDLVIDNNSIFLRVNAILSGAYKTNALNDNISENDISDNLVMTSKLETFIPFTEPYTGLGFNHFGSGGGEQFDDNLVTQLASKKIVDWLLLEIRDKTNPSIILETQSVLLLNNGQVIDTNGNIDISIALEENAYYVTLRHRNHLAVMTETPVLVNKSSTPVDFTNNSTKTWGSNAQREVASNVMALWAGNANSDDKIIFSGNDNDPTQLFFRILSNSSNGLVSPSYVMEGYFKEDLNLDGKIILQGAGTDANIPFFNCIEHPENTNSYTNYFIVEQLP